MQSKCENSLKTFGKAFQMSTSSRESQECAKLLINSQICLPPPSNQCFKNRNDEIEKQLMLWDCMTWLHEKRKTTVVTGFLTNTHIHTETYMYSISLLLPTFSWDEHSTNYNLNDNVQESSSPLSLWCDAFKWKSVSPVVTILLHSWG